MSPRQRQAAVFALFAAIALAFSHMARISTSPDPPIEKPAAAPWRSIVRVLDGDTVELDGKEIIRLLGVDTPESAANKKLKKDIEKIGATKEEMIDLGKEATRFVRGIAEGKECWLEYDIKPRDIYGRTIAYIHLDDGRILNEVIVYEGFGRAYLDYPFRYKRRYILLQRDAMEKKKGLWNENYEPKGD